MTFKDFIDRKKYPLGVAALFLFGAFTASVFWTIYSSAKFGALKSSHDHAITSMIESHEKQMARVNRSAAAAHGKLRNKIETKVDRLIVLVEQLPMTPTIYEVKRELHEVKKDD